jgi:hypothetical protein
MVVCEQHLTLLSGDRQTVQQIASRLEPTLGELVAPYSESLAA